MVCLTSCLSQQAGKLPLDSRKALPKIPLQFRDTAAVLAKGDVNQCMYEFWRQCKLEHDYNNKAASLWSNPFLAVPERRRHSRAGKGTE